MWSRDGRWIYFASKCTGTDQIWIVGPEGGDPRLLEITKACAVAGVRKVKASSKTVCKVLREINLQSAPPFRIGSLRPLETTLSLLNASIRKKNSQT